MVNGISVTMAVEVWPHLLCFKTMKVSEPLFNTGTAIIIGSTVNLRAVAGREDHGFVDPGLFVQTSQGSHDDVRPKSKALANIDGSSFVIEADG